MVVVVESKTTSGILEGIQVSFLNSLDQEVGYFQVYFVAVVTEGIQSNCRSRSYVIRNFVLGLKDTDYLRSFFFFFFFLFLFF